MIDSRAKLSITRQCRLLELSRASHYRSRAPRRETETALRRSLEAIYERHPYYGSRRMQLALQDRGWEVGRRRLRRLMRAMGLEPIHPKPRTSVKDPAHETYPYLLRRRRIDGPNAVWAADITYIPMRRGHVYLVAVMDWYSRRILSWRLSNTLGCELLRGGTERGIGASRLSDGVQYRSGIAVHQSRVSGGPARSRDRHQHGWQGLLARQRDDRAVLAFAQVRMRASPRL